MQSVIEELFSCAKRIDNIWRLLWFYHIKQNSYNNFGYITLLNYDENSLFSFFISRDTTF